MTSMLCMKVKDFESFMHEIIFFSFFDLFFFSCRVACEILVPALVPDLSS